MGATAVTGIDEGQHSLRERVESLRGTKRGAVALYAASVALLR